MAKQSGLHQIRGKVGEYSYYKQTGIESGLIRSINQGLSNRVKTSAEYVNTRLNNAEFGQACRIAGVLGQFVTPKYRPMILPFSQSKMAKIIVEAIRNSTGTWGQRNLGSQDLEPMLEAINSTHKNNPAEWGLTFSTNGEDTFSVITDDALYPLKIASIGADGVNAVLLACRPWIGTFVQSNNKYAQSFARANIYEDTLTSGGTVQFDIAFRPAPPPGWPATSVDFFVVVILPYRTINNDDYILQEHCTFVAVSSTAA